MFTQPLRCIIQFVISVQRFLWIHIWSFYHLWPLCSRNSMTNTQKTWFPGFLLFFHLTGNWCKVEIWAYVRVNYQIGQMYQQNESKNRTQNETLDGFLACYFWTLLKKDPVIRQLVHGQTNKQTDGLTELVLREAFKKKWIVWKFSTPFYHHTHSNVYIWCFIWVLFSLCALQSDKWYDII